MMQPQHKHPMPIPMPMHGAYILPHPYLAGVHWLKHWSKFLRLRSYGRGGGGVHPDVMAPMNCILKRSAGSGGAHPAGQPLAKKRRVAMSMPSQPPVPGHHNERRTAERAVTRIMNNLPVGVNSRLSGKKFNYVSGLLIEIPTGSGSKLAPDRQ